MTSPNPVDYDIHDEHGYKRLDLMSSDEKIDEILTHMRKFEVTVNELLMAAENSPMLRPMLKAGGMKLGPKGK